VWGFCGRREIKQSSALSDRSFRIANVDPRCFAIARAYRLTAATIG
jgi:hypothetical protein